MARTGLPHRVTFGGIPSRSHKLPSGHGIANESARIEVYSSRVLSADASTILVEAGNSTPTNWFLEQLAESRHADSTSRPAKRRKTDVDPPTQVAPIPLQRVALDLHFPGSDKPFNVLKDGVKHELNLAPAEGVSVRLRDVSLRGDQLQIAMQTKDKSVLVLETEEIPKVPRALLSDMASHTPYASLGTTKFERPASFVACYLKRAGGDKTTSLRLEATLLWRSGVSSFPFGVPRGLRYVYVDYELLNQAFPDSFRHKANPEQPQTSSDFYDSIQARLDSSGEPELMIDALDTELYPFQQDAVRWLLKREGVALQNGKLTEITRSAEVYFEPQKDADNMTCYVSHLLGIIMRNPPRSTSPLSGGLLAEEMGLGKTVELMALLCLHQRPQLEMASVRDEISGSMITPSRATLIITPPSILQQWVSEIQKHAPRLKVKVYDGIMKSSQSSKGETVIVEELSQDYDIVLATYNTLSKEIHFAEDPPQRNMRHARKFERKRSPLVQIQWWRICLDEAQMVESGVTAAAKVAQRLPRIHSWVVSGTPLRKNIQDLHGLLIFLGLQPFNNDAKLWAHLVEHHRPRFRQLWSNIGLRHTKAQVHEQLRLPSQRRVTLSVPFTAIEQQHYSTLFAEMCDRISLNEDGSPRTVDWDPAKHVEEMRGWLVRLRQTCLHPQVGGRNRRALGKAQGPLRTVAEVLEVMIEQNEAQLRTEERNYLTSRLTHAHIVGYNKADVHRSEKALDIYTSILESCEDQVKEARSRLDVAKSKFASTRELKSSGSESDDDANDGESKSALGRFRTHLRGTLHLLHTSLFFTATAYYQIKTQEELTAPESDDFTKLEEKETTLYERAKVVRREILRDSSRRAETYMRKIDDMMAHTGMTKIPGIKPLKSLSGIENRRIVEKSDDLFDTIGDVCKVIIDWRQKMAEYLTKPLIDEDEGMETTGEEYEQSTKQQDELYVYFDCVKALQADLNTFVTGESAPLIDHEVKTMIREAKWALKPDNKNEILVHAPALLLELLEIRTGFRRRVPETGSVRGLIQEARSLESTLSLLGGPRSEGERSLVQQHMLSLQKVYSDYSKVINELEKEVELFRTTQNLRLEFYRQLQELSDDVAPYKEELDETLDTAALDASIEKEEQHGRVMSQLRTKHRFLLHLQNESASPESARMCVICQCPFESGVLTICGHQYCKECIHLWWSQHRTCPVCKRRLHTVDFHDVTYKPQELHAKEEGPTLVNGKSESKEDVADRAKSQSNWIYTDINRELMDEIKSIDLPSSYGTKIDTLGRHLHWLRQHDAGAKAIVFSQFREFLDVLGAALTEFKIGHTRLGRGGAVERFRLDPSIDCLLLDAKTDSSGLTLVNATHVFICEPLIHTAVELQAIARVHRIGQTRQTTVWMYVINDTVEEAIHELSVARRLAHVQSHASTAPDQALDDASTAEKLANHDVLQEKMLEAADTAELQSAPLAKFLEVGKGGGEVVATDDLWHCLFDTRRRKTQNASTSSALADAAAVEERDEARNEAGEAVNNVHREVDRFMRAEAAEARRGN